MSRKKAWELLLHISSNKYSLVARNILNTIRDDLKQYTKISQNQNAVKVKQFPYCLKLKYT